MFKISEVFLSRLGMTVSLVRERNKESHIYKKAWYSSLNSE
jgi:hypothetical protein